MHELAICESLMSQVEEIARSRNKNKVCSIVIGLGPLSGVEACLLQNAYTIACADSIASDAELVIEQLPLIVRCSQCGVESQVIPNRLVCKHCGDWRTTLISGDEMMLMSVVLEDESDDTHKDTTDDKDDVASATSLDELSKNLYH